MIVIGALRRRDSVAASAMKARQKHMYNTLAENTNNRYKDPNFPAIFIKQEMLIG